MNNQYYVKDFGAVGDGKIKDTKVIQEVIDLCNLNGGGKIIFDNGNFLCGGIYLKSNVFLEIDSSARLLASEDIDDYQEDTHYNRYRNELELDRCFIYAQNEKNIGICGTGEINGNAEKFPNQGSIYRPMMIRFLNCNNINIKDISLYNAASWTTAFLDSKYIWVDGVKILNEKNYNGDGLDFDGCRHVYVSNCFIKGTDDNLCLQAGNKEFPVQDIHITNCEFSSICAAIRIGLKSIGDISDVVIENCTMHNVFREGVKIECTEGGNISNIIIRGIVMRNVRRPIFVILNNQFNEKGLGNSIELKALSNIGRLENLIISDFIITDEEEMKNAHYRFQNDLMGSPRFNGIRFDAAEKFPIKNIMLKNIIYTAIGGVKKIDIPQEYPVVLDLKEYQEEVVSSNYYPDWSRTAFIDIRNVENLILEDILLKNIYEDERCKVLIEKCVILKENIVEL